MLHTQVKANEEEGEERLTCQLFWRHPGDKSVGILDQDHIIESFKIFISPGN